MLFLIFYHGFGERVHDSFNSIFSLLFFLFSLLFQLIQEGSVFLLHFDFLLLFVFFVHIHPHFVPLVLLHRAGKPVLLLLLASLGLLLLTLYFLFYALDKQLVNLFFPLFVKLFPQLLVLDLFIPLHFFVLNLLQGLILFILFPLVINAQLLSVEFNVCLFILIFIVFFLLLFIQLFIQLVLNLLLEFVLPSLFQLLFLLE